MSEPDGPADAIPEFVSAQASVQTAAPGLVTGAGPDPGDDDPVATLACAVARLEARVVRLERAGGATGAAPDAGARRTSEAAARLEARLGTYWLSRLGIVSLITGTALLILTYFGELGPVLRVALGYLIAAALIATGRWIAGHHRVFGNVIFGGGLAIGYFVTYALHFVRPMQIVASEVAGVALVGAAIAAIVATAHRMKSETVAGIALFLGLHTGLLTDVTALTLVCTTLLAIGAVFFLAANRWVIVPLSCVVAVYSTHGRWELGGPAAAMGPGLGVAFLAIDFVLFAIASLIHPDLRPRSLAALALLNWAGMLALASYALRDRPHDALFAVLCALAAAHVALAVLARIRNAPRGFVGLEVALAITTLALALPARLEAWPLVAGWVGLALAAAVTARRAHAPVFGWVALAILVVVQGDPGARQLGAPVQLVCALAFLATERLAAAPAGGRRAAVQLPCVAGLAIALLRFTDRTLPPGLESLGWVGAAFALFALGFALREAGHRWGGFAVLAAAAVRIGAVDLGHLSANQRILTFVIAGVLLLAISYFYTRIRAARAGAEAELPEREPRPLPVSRAARRPGG